MPHPLLLWLLAVCAAACSAQTKTEPAPSKPADPGQAQAKLLEAFAKVGLEVDLTKKSVAMPAKMSRPGDLIEYVLITRRGKAHESLLVVDVQPSLLNAALLAIGLTPGTNAIVKDKDPLPSEEEVRNGVEWFTVTPPTGPELWLSVQWRDEEGKAHELLVEDLLLDVTTGEAAEACQWIYIGGRTAAPYRGEPPVYIADLEGNLVSTFYVEPNNHLVTMRHERARSDQNWWITDACPMAGTEMKLVMHTQKPKLATEREARLAADKAAGKKPRGPLKDLPAQPAGEGSAAKREPEAGKGDGKEPAKEPGRSKG